VLSSDLCRTEEEFQEQEEEQTDEAQRVCEAPGLRISHIYRMDRPMPKLKQSEKQRQRDR
jgi:hypothetical protein